MKNSRSLEAEKSKMEAVAVMVSIKSCLLFPWCLVSPSMLGELMVKAGWVVLFCLVHVDMDSLTLIIP